MLLSLITCPTPLPLLHQFLNWYTRYVEDDERNSTKMGRLRAKLRRKKQFKKVRKQLVKLGPTEKAKAKFRRGVKLAFEDVKSQIRALGKSAELFELMEEGYDEHYAAKVQRVLFACFGFACFFCALNSTTQASTFMSACITYVCDPLIFFGHRGCKFALKTWT